MSYVILVLLCLAAKILNLLKEMGNIASESRGVFQSKCNILITTDSTGILLGGFNVRPFRIKCLSWAFPAYETRQNGVVRLGDTVVGLCHCHCRSVQSPRDYVRGSVGCASPAAQGPAAHASGTLGCGRHGSFSFQHSTDVHFL